MTDRPPPPEPPPIELFTKGGPLPPPPMPARPAPHSFRKDGGAGRYDWVPLAAVAVLASVAIGLAVFGVPSPTGPAAAVPPARMQMVAPPARMQMVERTTYPAGNLVIFRDTKTGAEFVVVNGVAIAPIPPQVPAVADGPRAGSRAVTVIPVAPVPFLASTADPYITPPTDDLYRRAFAGVRAEKGDRPADPDPDPMPPPPPPRP